VTEVAIIRDERDVVIDAGPSDEANRSQSPAIFTRFPNVIHIEMDRSDKTENLLVDAVPPRFLNLSRRTSRAAAFCSGVS
jgi:hypothetical protein